MTLTGIFIAYRAGILFAAEQEKPGLYNTNQPDTNRYQISYLNADTVPFKNDSAIPKLLPLSTAGFKMDENALLLQILKNAMQKNDTLEVILPDSIFPLNTSLVGIGKQTQEKAVIEMHLKQLLDERIRLQNKLLSSSKSMQIFSENDRLIHIKNYKFKYNRLFHMDSLNKHQEKENNTGTMISGSHPAERIGRTDLAHNTHPLLRTNSMVKKIPPLWYDRSL
jgi:hypothetical protein